MLTAAAIDSDVNAILARLQDPRLLKDDRDKLRIILDQYLDAREDLVLSDLAGAAAKVSEATRSLQDFIASRSVNTSAIEQPSPEDSQSDPPAEGDNQGLVAPDSEPRATATIIEDGFERIIGGIGLRYFKSYELLVKGGANSNPSSEAFNLNTDPPADMWQNIVPTIKALDELRHRLQRPVIISSVYRSAAYNRAIGGARDSQHTHFRAIDFVVRGITTGPQDWAAVLRDMRQAGIFSGGIGIYPAFVHIDTRGSNADWGA